MDHALSDNTKRAGRPGATLVIGITRTNEEAPFCRSTWLGTCGCKAVVFMGLVDFLLRPTTCVRVLCRATSQRLLVDPSILSVLQTVLGAGMTLVTVRRS